MDDWKDPEDMTLQERLDRIIELLAIALRRLVEEEKGKR